MLKRIMLFLLAACLPLAAPALAEGGERPQIILMACYQQVGWGVYADVAFLDEEGGIWYYENEMGLPREDAERLELLGKTEDVERVGQLDKRRVEEIRSLIAAIQPEEVKRGPGHILDYGLDTYSAIRYGDGGEAEIICLAKWGDWTYENTDINARAVYLALFTEVLGYDLDSDEYEFLYQPTPFERMSLTDFCGVEKGVFEGATVTLRENGTERTLEGAEAEEKLAWLQSLAVTGKRSALTADGGETAYLLVTPEGIQAEFVFSDGLLAMPDGMYTVEALSPEELQKLENSKKAQDVFDRMKKGVRKGLEQ